MFILGIDPGSQKSGYALIEVVGHKIHHKDSGVIRYDLKGDFFDRLHEIHMKALELVSLTSPIEIALESLIYVKSPTAIIKLSQARGAMISAFVQTHKGRIFEYSPNLVKSSVSGHGHASKESIQKMISLLTGVKSFETDDESDALAIAICHAINRNKGLVSGASKKRKGSYAKSLEHKVKRV